MPSSKTVSTNLYIKKVQENIFSQRKLKKPRPFWDMLLYTIQEHFY